MKSPKKRAIHSKMKLSEVVEAYPETVEIFYKYGLHCVGCHVASFETLEEGALGHGITGKGLEKMLEELNKAIK